MNLTPREAADALAEVDQARSTMRHVIRAHRGHFHLWIWGATWVVMSLTAHLGGDRSARYFPLICLVSGIASGWIGFTQGRQVRLPANGRCLALVGALLGFAAVFPFVLRAQLDVRTTYAYISLVMMQNYVVAGIWTDSYLLWLGMVVSALVLAGLFLFPGIFWIWMAVFGGGSLIFSGFYVRYFWR